MTNTEKRVIETLRNLSEEEKIQIALLAHKQGISLEEDFVPNVAYCFDTIESVFNDFMDIIRESLYVQNMKFLNGEDE